MDRVSEVILNPIVASFTKTTTDFQVFSKLTEQRFPSEFELRDLIGSRLPESSFGRNLGKTLT
jgi:hypothetical protein